MADSKKYRFVDYVSAAHRMDRLEVGGGKVLEFDPDRTKDPVLLTEKQYQSLIPFAVLEVADEGQDEESPEDSPEGPSGDSPESPAGSRSSLSTARKGA